jgi:hypothetical protein
VLTQIREEREKREREGNDSRTISKCRFFDSSSLLPTFPNSDRLMSKFSSLIEIAPSQIKLIASQ